MKIHCSVEVLNRSLPSLNIRGKKSVRSSLTIVKSNQDIIIVHQTNENLNGNKYKASNNVLNVFVKFVNEGKATIRFKEPEHDLAIKCDSLQLKGFLKTLKLGLDGIHSHQLSKLNTCNLQTKKLKPIKTKLKITAKEDYPVLEGFQRTLESLTVSIDVLKDIQVVTGRPTVKLSVKLNVGTGTVQLPNGQITDISVLINNVNQKSLDSRILRLRNLYTLNIENNSLTTLPEQLGSSLPNLAELHLRNNLLGHGQDWKWIVNKNFQKQLRLLDLRSNEVTYLPDKMVALSKLVTLKVDDNHLNYLPDGIGCMTSLRFFSASNNQINYLPGSILSLKLDSIDLSANNFSRNVNKKLGFFDFQTVPCLVDISASIVINKRIQYSEGILPRTLIDHLLTASFCACGKPCFSKQPVSLIRYQNKESRATTVVSSYNCNYSVAVRYCSFQCYSKQETVS